jgi:ribosomal protein S18 acetylase RimI-like enzyme
MTIRRATEQDAQVLAELVQLAIRDIGYQLTGERTEAEVIAQLERFCMEEGNRFSKELYLVKEDGHHIAGMILCYHGRDAERLYQPIIEHLVRVQGVREVRIDQEADEDEYYIDALAVLPGYQGRGYGRQLLRAAEQHAAEQGHHKIALNVDQDNEKALKLYQHIGYQAEKAITINGRPYWHMSKVL